MNDTQKKFLERGMMVLPEVIDHATYETVLEALLIERPTDEVRLYCKGDGGDSRAMAAIIDAIETHGNVTGVLLGEAISSHATIFAACPRRYVAPRGAIGLHKVSSYVNVPIDSTYARLLAAQQQFSDDIAAELYARIGGQTVSWWRDQLNDTGCNGVKLMDARQLIAWGMAQPLSALVPLKLPDVVEAEAVETI